MIGSAIVAAGAAGWFLLRPSAGSVEIGGPFALVDGDGKAFTDRDLRGAFALVYFGYTFCPDVCPTTLAAMTAAVDALGVDAARVRPVFITIDPARDTPAKVREYAAAFSPRLVGLTGDAAAIAHAAGEYRVYYAPHRTGPGPGDYTMDHSSVIYLVDPQGQFRAVIRADQPPSDIAAEIRRNLTT